MEKVYLLYEGRGDNYGNHHGRVVSEDGSALGEHWSSTVEWLKIDLSQYVDVSKYEIVNLLGQPVPDRFKVSVESCDTEKLHAIAAKFKETLSFFVVNTELRSNEAVDALGEFERAVDLAVEKLEGFGK